MHKAKPASDHLIIDTQLMETAISSHNKNNKKHIATAIATIYMPSNNLPDYILDIILKRLIWATTEYNDQGEWKKYDGVPYWSIGAIRQRRKNISEKVHCDKDLRHEHSIPRSIILKKIKSLQEKSTENIYDILDKYCHAVVVAKDEDKLLNKYRAKMPDNQLQENNLVENIFSRYKAAQIKVLNITGVPIDSLSDKEILEIEQTGKYFHCLPINQFVTNN